MLICNQCPRNCHIDRENTLGYCGAPAAFRIARADLHPWEEPPISGTRGSGTVFFCGCNLRCVFCQNREISHGTVGKDVSAERLAALFFELRDRGAHNINLVTPSHYARELSQVLRNVKPDLGIPVVYNSGGYDSPETLRLLDGLVDVWLPDIKYYSAELSARYSGAKDYYSVAITALREMLRQAPRLAFAEDGTLRTGVILRHLVLPGCRADSINLLRALKQEFGTDAFRISLMSQYTPGFAPPDADRSLHRRVTAFEYQSVVDAAVDLGFDGYFQSRDSASSSYTPNFKESVDNI